MKRREFLRAGIATSLLSLLPKGGLFAESSASAARPNGLFLFSDQHNAGIMSCAGHPNVHTPALDRLASGGVRFDRAYCQDGVCCPSRTSIFTGQYPRTLGMYDNGGLGPRAFEASVVSSLTPMQRHFRNAGYYTFTAGKRHLLPQMDPGWDYSAGNLLGGGGWGTERNDTLNYWTWIEQQGLMDRMMKDWNCEFGRKEHTLLACGVSSLPPEATMEAFTARQTVEFLRSAKAKQQPFFAWSTFYRPHQPYTPQQKYIDQIDFASLRLPDSLRQDPRELPPELCATRLSSHGGCWSCADADETAYRRYIGYYIALVHEIDHHIHTILDVLEKEGLAENTIVVYSSDHGDFVGGHGLPEKQAGGHNFYEETLRVPLIFNYPGKIASGVVRQDLVELVDLYPTLLDLCGMTPPKSHSLAGRSLAETLRSQKPVGRKYVVSENWSQAAVITGDFKYGQWLQSGRGPKSDWRKWGNMLVERASDPSEVRNRIADPLLAAKSREMEGFLMEWVNKIDDSGRREFFEKSKIAYSVV